MIVGLAWMLVANVAILQFGRCAIRRLGTGDVSVDALLFVLVRLLLISILVLAAGMSGCLSPWKVGVAGLALLALTTAAGRLPGLPRLPRPEIGRGTALLLGLVGLRLLAQTWFFAPYSPDALSYRLPQLAEWIRAGGFTREVGIDLCAPLPAGFELIEAWWVVFLRHDVLIELAGAEFAVLALAAVRVLALRLGLSPKAAWLAATLYLLTPLFSVDATSCMNDGAVAALVLALAALTTARLHPLLLLVPAGLLGGIKATGCFTFPAWILLLALRRRDPFLRPSSLRFAAGFAAAALAAGGFWYVRNWVWWGNPLYPVGVNDPIFGQILVQTGPSLASLSSNFQALLNFRIYDHMGGINTLSREVAGWGAVAFACGTVAVIGEIRRDRTFRQVALAFVVALSLVLLLVTPDPWMARFVLFFPGLLCIAAARLSETVRPAAALIAVAAVLEFGAGLLPGDLQAPQWRSLSAQPWRERSSASFYGGAPEGESVGVYARTRKILYPLYGPGYSRRVVYFRQATAEGLVEAMQREGVRVLTVDRSNRRRRDFDDLLQQGRLRALGGDYYALP